DGGNGSDLISGGAGNDVIDGGNGQDTLVLDGKRSDYRVMEGLNGAIVVRDLRANGQDGEDRLFSIERIQFSDGTFKLVDLIEANGAPVAQNDALTLAENAGKTEITSVLLANDSDADGDSLIVSAVQAVSAQGAAVSIGPDGKVSYDAGSIFADLDNGETATDSFTYTITDGNGHVSTATATVTITGVGQNTAPVAVNDKMTLAEDAGPTDVTSNLIGNDIDPDGDSFQVTSVQAVSNRGVVVTVGPDGKVTYDAGQIFMDLEAGEKLTDTFAYTITDSQGLTSTATASVTITGVTQEPDAYFYIQEDATRDDLLGLLTDWLDMGIVGVDSSKGTLGTVSFEGGVLSFAADHDFSDHLLPDQSHSTTFTVTGPDGQKKTIEAIVEGVNDQIVAVDDAFAVGEGQTSVNLWKAIVSNEIDPDGSIHSNRILEVGTEGTQGLVSFDASSRTLTYSAANIDLAPGETMTDSFTYVVTDGWGSQDTATVFVTVTGAAGGGAMTSMSGGESIMSAFVGGAGGSHLDDAEFASFPSMQAMQEMLVADAVIA
ncbi:MAG TPA: Ig-like domain-containing protein, partial [Allosphingosinicella sp.]